MYSLNSFPRQKLSFKKKGEKWRKDVVDWADTNTLSGDSPIRKSIRHKSINYGLIAGELDMEDLTMILNPENIEGGFIPEKIQHYPILNSKLNVLRGEEIKRRFDYRLVITNPNAISEMEEAKKEAIFSDLQSLITETSQSEEEFNKRFNKLQEYYDYTYQDIREIRGNSLLKHYLTELEVKDKFSAGFLDALTCGEEMYQCDIVSNEPIIERLNPQKVAVFSSGYSSKVEDADIIVIKDFWNPGKILDYFYDDLTEADVKKIEDVGIVGGPQAVDSMGNIDERRGLVQLGEDGILYPPGTIINNFIDFMGGPDGSDYTDSFGNIKVIRVFWKSKRKIKKVKYYDEETGEALFEFFDETYEIDKSRGEEETIYWINEAWEGTKIGKDIYVRMGPRKVQYNRMNNPSRCHLGVIGSYYNLNDDAPFSLVDMMKPYSYTYDVVHDNLNRALASNWGKLIKLDLAQVPDKWDINKWLYYAKKSHLLVVDSFNEGNKGAATGKLAGGYAANSGGGAIDAETGNYIQQLINILEYLKNEMSEGVGITKQREGQISNRETVGGIERSNVQSSHITEWFFSIHDNIKKRVIEALLETIKITAKGKNLKFPYILSDLSIKFMDIPGDEFAESDYGLLVDNSPGVQELNSDLKTLAQAALQNNILDFSTVIKIYTSSSMSETQRLIEKNERELKERNAQQIQIQQEQVQAQLQQQAEVEQTKLQLEESKNIRDNQTKLMIAQMSLPDNMETSSLSKEELIERIREFDKKMELDNKKLKLEEKKHSENLALKNKEINSRNDNK